MDATDRKILQKIQSVDIERVAPTLTVDYITEELGYEQFFLRYLLPNKPCVLGPHVTADWRSREEWVTDDGKPDLDFLAEKFGSSIVPVADCNRVKFYAQPKRAMKLSEYMEYWKNRTNQDGCLYLKDWHFVHMFPDYQAYKTPLYFMSDWLNEFWDQRSDRSDDDYRFVYMGPKGSWTPFHADVFRSFSWSANICGRKKWLLYPPGEEEYLKDHLGNLAYDVTSSEMHDGKMYPKFEKACQPFEVVQEAGEVIFVPSGWHHQVFNLEDTISINHNWLNGCSLDIMWRFLQQELSAVQESISDCIDMDGWHAQCQLIMKASTGIDYAEFFLFLHIIAMQRLQMLKNSTDSKLTYSEKKTDTGYKGSDEVHVREMQRLHMLKNRTDSKPSDDEKKTDIEYKEPCGEYIQEAGSKLACEPSEVENTHRTSERTEVHVQEVASNLACESGEVENTQRISERTQTIDKLVSETLAEKDSLNRTTSETPADKDINKAVSFRKGQDLSIATETLHALMSSTSEHKSESSCQLSGHSSQNKQDVHCLWHIVFDLQRIKIVLQRLISNTEFREIDGSLLCDDPQKLFNEICSVIDKFL